MLSSWVSHFVWKRLINYIRETILYAKKQNDSEVKYVPKSGEIGMPGTSQEDDHAIFAVDE